MYHLQGIQYLIEHKLLTPDAQDIAQFLYKGEGLNKTAIGTYLGERSGGRGLRKAGNEDVQLCTGMCEGWVVCAGN